jgi:hypothetical protein
MTVPPVPEPDGGNPDSEVDDIADFIPDGDRAAQAESAWPDDAPQDLVPDGDREVPDLEEG